MKAKKILVHHQVRWYLLIWSDLWAELKGKITCICMRGVALLSLSADSVRVGASLLLSARRWAPPILPQAPNISAPDKSTMLTSKDKMGVCNSLELAGRKRWTAMLKGTQAWNNFFLPKSNPYMPLVNFRKKFRFVSFDFCQNFEVPTFSRWLSICGTQVFFRDIQKFFSKMFTLLLLDGFLNGFSKSRIFIVKICILICDFWVIFENYSMRMLSICGKILSHKERTRKQFHRTLSIRETNFRACSASGKMWTVFTCKYMLSICGTNFIPHRAYAEQISSLAEHTRNGFHRWLSISGNI